MLRVKLQRRETGFSLIEFIVTIVIISILVFLVSMIWPGDTITLKTQSERLGNDVRYMQFLSMALNKSTRINFWPTQYSFTEIDGVTPINHPATNLNTVTLPTNMVLTTMELGGGYLVFDRKGVPYTDDTLGTPLSVDASITLSMGAETRSIVVSPETGKVTGP